MNAVPPSMTPGAIGGHWAALRETGEVVAALAGIEPGESPDFRELLRQAPEWQRELAEQAAADIAAAMQPGLCGLSALAVRGADPRAAARALWEEFLLAREAVLGLATSHGTARDA
jgi:ABC-type sugar transport system substrate-binding protein